MSAIANTLEGNREMPSLETEWPKKDTVESPNLHFSRLMERPAEAKRPITARRWSRQRSLEVQVDEAELQTPEDTVHQMLEGLGGVLQHKQHVKELKQAEWGYDGRFLDVYVSHRELVVTPDKVHHGEDDRAGCG